MKVYVNELPNSCEECPMCRSGILKLQRKGRYIEAEQCVFGQYKYHTIDDEIDTCPLQSLADYTKQVRKEVCEEIREICKLNIRTYKIQSQDDCERYKEVDAFNKAIFGVLDTLDQIQDKEK